MLRKILEKRISYFGSGTRDFDIFVIKFVVREEIISKSFGRGIIYTLNCVAVSFQDTVFLLNFIFSVFH